MTNTRMMLGVTVHRDFRRTDTHGPPVDSLSTNLQKGWTVTANQSAPGHKDNYPFGWALHQFINHRVAS